MLCARYRAGRAQSCFLTILHRPTTVPRNRLAPQICSIPWTVHPIGTCTPCPCICASHCVPLHNINAYAPALHTATDGYAITQIATAYVPPHDWHPEGCTRHSWHSEGCIRHIHHRHSEGLTRHIRTPQQAKCGAPFKYTYIYTSIVYTHAHVRAICR